MKKLMIPTVMVLMLFGALSAQAGSTGSAIVPTVVLHYNNSQSHSWVNLLLSNIVDKEITCSVQVFDQDGVDITDTVISNLYTGSPAGIQPIGTSAVFNIPAHGSRLLQLYKATMHGTLAHAIIQWSSEDKAIGKALVGSVSSQSTVYGSSSIPINNGQPF